VACFTGDYPVGFESEPSKLALEQSDSGRART
jgi:hypothetical protein